MKILLLIKSLFKFVTAILAKANTRTYTTHGLKAAAILAILFYDIFCICRCQSGLSKGRMRLGSSCNCHSLQAVDKGQTRGFAKNPKVQDV